MRIKLVLTAVLLVTAISQTFAHALWIETNPVGVNGKKQEIRIFFGEYADKDISPAAKWFSDLKNFTLVLIAPDKSETKLVSKAATDNYVAEFTPTQNGVYTVVAHHVVGEIYQGLQLNYNSSATIVVGKDLKGNDASINSNIISIFGDAVFIAKTNTPVKLKSIYEAKPAGEHELKVFAPNGWGKELYTNETGEANFTPIWAGKYMAEISYKNETPGEQNGKKYEAVMNIATYIVDVKQ